MNWMRFPAVILCLSWLAFAPAARAQFGWLDEPEDTTRTLPADSAQPALQEGDVNNPLGIKDSTEDSTEVPADSVRVRQGEQENTSQSGPDAVIRRAHEWVRRLLFRGQFDGAHIGAYTTYQLSAWEESTGAYGPVEARITVYYLGTTEWRGEDAEWLQISYNTMGDDPGVIEYDLIVSSAVDIRQIYRALYRVDGEDLKTVSFAMPPDQLDYDLADQPSDDGHAELDIYYGTFDTQRFRGAGTGGVEVVMYYFNGVRPLGLVRLGYGDEALTLTDQGSDARPRFNVPPPPRGE